MDVDLCVFKVLSETARWRSVPLRKIYVVTCLCLNEILSFTAYGFFWR